MKQTLVGVIMLLLMDGLPPGGGEVDFSLLLSEDIKVTRNPSGIAPLTALVTLKTKHYSAIKIRVLGDTELTHNFSDLSKEHEIPILGLYPDYTNKVVIIVEDNKGYFASKTIEIQTDPLPDYFPDLEISTANTSKMEPGWQLCTFAIGMGDHFNTLPFVFDMDGAIRWYLDLTAYEKFMAPIELLKNGNLVFGSNSYVYEYDFLGKKVKEWAINGYGQHHDIIEKPNGNLVVAVNKYSAPTSDDHIIEIDRHSGDIINEWDLRQLLDIDRYDLEESEIDWFHMNAIWYSESDDCLIVSGRNQAVVKITSSNKLKWILAPHQGWGKAGVDGNGAETTPNLLLAVDSLGVAYDEDVQMGVQEPANFSWVWGQHAPLILPNGNYFIYDNGYHRNFMDNHGNTSYSRAVEYAIDDDNMTVQQVWEYGKERYGELFSPIISDVDYLPNTQNRLMTSGIIWTDGPAHTKIVEIGYPDKEIIFEAEIVFKNLFIDPNGGGWGNLDLIYRSERIHLYQ